MAETGSAEPRRTVVTMPKEPLQITPFDSVLEKIKQWVDNTEPDSVRRSGDYYLAARDLLEEAARELKRKATDLADHYGGAEGAQTQKQLQFLHATIRELAAKMGMMGPPLREYADTLVWARQNLVVKRGEDSRSDHDTDWADHVPFYGMYRVEDRARDHFSRVNERITEHYTLLPDDVQSALPTPTPVDLPTFRQTGLPPGALEAPPGTGGFGALDASDGAGDLPGQPRFPGGPGQEGAYGLDPSAPGVIGPDEGAGSSVPGSGDGRPGVVQPSWPGGPDGRNPDLPSPDGVGDIAGAGQGDGSHPPDADESRLAGLNDTAQARAANASANGPFGAGTSGGTGAGGTGAGGAGTGAAAYGIAGGGGDGSRTAARAATGGMSGVPLYGAAGQGRAGEKDPTSESTTRVLEDDDVWGGGGPTTPSLLT
ncbi:MULTISPECIES: hypothetical protein [unclassified Streptosporangium]|uniref:hypothetical protein n=1 Tax=unclassified Streptosporangium TaxID=2632669 RepID=UPI002E29B3CB|nr:MULTISPECIES: hypothetical protein [unclassified Streptosporangium]